MKRKINNQQLATMLSNHIYSKICDFFNAKMIYVPLSIVNDINNVAEQILNENIKDDDAVNLELMKRGLANRNAKTGSALKILLNSSTDKIWTIQELSEASNVASSAIHKLKHRLLSIGALAIYPKFKAKFYVTHNGKGIIKELLDIN